MKARVVAWLPATILAVGALLTVGIDTQRSMPLREELSAAVPMALDGYTGEDLTISDDELRVVGVSDYLYRVYQPEAAAAADAAGAAPFTLYVGYYQRQERGRTIHSPKNCLPGAGWEPLTSTIDTVALAGGGTAVVNRYLIQRESEQALVLYWYQGRGRIASNEYRVKLELLRDSALRGRSDEALVRLVVPVTSSMDEAADLAENAAAQVIPALAAALPG